MNSKRFGLLMVYSLIIISLIFLPKMFTLSLGKDILLKTEPVDPRDVFRGDYVNLNYEISTIDLDKTPFDHEFMMGESIYAKLSEKEKYWTIDWVSHRKPDVSDEDVCMKGVVTSSYDDTLNVRWGIESYFVPEGDGIPIQMQMENTSVIVSVGPDCSAVLKQLLIDDEPVTFE
ncbi:GDYXXLXY domain-containing protein [Methanococcoides orientis]|uniref:GDYXXLXY domain-containing protein n=1 Tax=Methanococcoides orientis TaxID=2822137 RepID=UPI001E584EB7|nr:GDYXXLXY domain-containing protein [Methanococcoides orientis]UGV39848.1 GDYXXLXY domain-containing protein [Methanococcoides orientis]